MAAASGSRSFSVLAATPSMSVFTLGLRKACLICLGSYSISSVRDAIFIGLILACIILFLFLRDWTSSLVAGLVIPVTIAVTILVLWGIGQSFNLMTLGGLAAAIGLVIDDAIVV